MGRLPAAQYRGPGMCCDGATTGQWESKAKPLSPIADSGGNRSERLFEDGRFSEACPDPLPCGIYWGKPMRSPDKRMTSWRLG
jgi:hypothetical protein